MFDKSKVKVIGFDLDQTLYPKSPEIDEAIQTYIYDKIVDAKGCTREEAREMFLSYYPKLSGSKALKALEIPDSKNIVQEALENADIAQFLIPDTELIEMLEKLDKLYSLALITGSFKEVAKNKLEKLRIPLSLFDFCCYGTTSKRNGDAYREWIEHAREDDESMEPENFLYVGDREQSDVIVPLKLGMQAALVYVKNEELEGEYVKLLRPHDVISVL